MFAQDDEGGHTIGVIGGAAGFSEASRDAATECTDRTRPRLPGKSAASHNVRIATSNQTKQNKKIFSHSKHRYISLGKTEKMTAVPSWHL